MKTNKASAACGLLALFCSVGVLRAQQLRTEYPEIRLSDKRVLAHARVESFDGISFCISHESGIEAAVPWEIMPNAWKTAFPRDPELRSRIAERARVDEKEHPQPPPGSLKPAPGQYRPSQASVHDASDENASEAELAKTAATEKKARQEAFDRAVLENKVMIGMSAEQCEKSWGKPHDINQTADASSVDQFWHYSADRTLVFRNGVLIIMSSSGVPAGSPPP